jgi:hypothetical protein
LFFYLIVIHLSLPSPLSFTLKEYRKYRSKHAVTVKQKLRNSAMLLTDLVQRFLRGPYPLWALKNLHSSQACFCNYTNVNIFILFCAEVVSRLTLRVITFPVSTSKQK